MQCPAAKYYYYVLIKSTKLFYKDIGMQQKKKVSKKNTALETCSSVMMPDAFNCPTVQTNHRLTTYVR